MKQQPQVALNVRINYDLAKELDTHCKESGETKTDVVRKALEAYLNK